ncbi:DUF1501 domain-containing protein [Nannocystaceae bacterium ST9]
MQRRNFLHLGLAGLGAGLLLGGSSRVRAGNLAGTQVGKPASRCVVLFMHGGASQIDTFDPKPDTSNGGEFKAIASAIAGVRISEHLPGLAERMDRLALIRSLSAKEGNHDRARTLMHTGYAPQGGVEHPGLGAHVARMAELGEPDRAMPGQVSINLPGQSPGYLGAAHAAFTVADASKPVRNLAPPIAIAEPRRDRRVELWRELDQRFASTHAGPRVEGARALGERAVAMTQAAELDAFELDQESPATRARYGEGSFADGCLMARRLLGAGVPFVEVGMRGWDTHEDNFTRVRDLSRELDKAMSALIDDLIDTGMWSDTLLVWLGDFGRTPRISARGGRDHFPKISSVVLGGGPIRAGQVIGATDREGEQITEHPVRVADLFTTLALALAIDPGETHVTPAGRPVTTVDEAGEAIAGLLT